MFDFGTFPPEVTSNRLSCGPGSGSMMTAAAAWDALANILESAAVDYSSVIAALRGESWSGRASDAMADAAAPYLAWMAATEENAVEAARRARAAAAAFEVALASIVPPMTVAANRSLLTQLLSTNTFGQNAPSIAAAEAAYEEMWAQDAAAMYEYAASSAALTMLTPFSDPPPITRLAGPSIHGAAVAHSFSTSSVGGTRPLLSQLTSVVPEVLKSLAAVDVGDAVRPLGPFVQLESLVLNAFGDFNTLTAPINLCSGVIRTYTSGGSCAYAAKRDVEAHTTPAAAPASELADAESEMFKSRSTGMGGPVFATVGQAAPIGGLSAPQSWASTTPVAALSEDAQWLPEADLADTPGWTEEPSSSLLGGAPAAGLASTAGPWRPTVTNVLRVQPRRFKMPRPFLGG